MEYDIVSEDSLKLLIVLYICGLLLGGIMYLLTKACSFVFEMFLYLFCFFYPLKRAKSKKVIWFTRRVIVNDLSKMGEKELKAVEDEERRKCTRLSIVRKDVLNFLFGNKLFEFFFKKRNDEMTLWIPLNDNESSAIEGYFLSRTTRGRRPPIVMNGLFKVSDKACTKLTPIHWENENAIWLLMRGEYVCEIPLTPTSSYYMSIKPDMKMKSFYQPVVGSDQTSIKDEYDFSKFRAIDKTNDNQHIIFVIHGIGHHEGEEGIVENANDVRDGFVKYLKKFHPTYSTPLVIPIAWRCNLKMDEEKIRATQSLKFELAKKLGIIFNDPFYYSAEYKDEIKKSLIERLNTKFEFFKSKNPKISILAHSLGSVIAFDVLHDECCSTVKKLKFEVENVFLIGSPLSRFLINSKFDVNKLKNNKWVQNGRLFNIINPDDPVVHRFEALFNPDYEYVEPVPLSLRESTDNTLKLSLPEQLKFDKFHKQFADEREIALKHDSFYEIDYRKKESDEEVNDGLPNDIITKLSETKIVSTAITEIPVEDRIPNRFDYNLFDTRYRQKFMNFETYSFTWAKKFAFSHTSYWRSQETIALMTNVIHGYGSGPGTENHIGESKLAKVFYGIVNFLWIVCPPLILATCRFLCTICFIDHLKFVTKFENWQLFLFYMTVLAFKDFRLSQYVHNFYMIIFVYISCFILFVFVSFDMFNVQSYLSKFIFFHQIIYECFLIIFSINLPNLHKPVGLLWNIFVYYGNNFSKLFLYFVFFFPSIVFALISYMFFDNSDFSTTYFIFWRTYTFTLLFCSVIQFFFEWSSIHINSDKFEHVSSPDRKDCFRVNIFCKKQDGNELEFGCVKKKRFSNETDKLEKNMLPRKLTFLVADKKHTFLPPD